MMRALRASHTLDVFVKEPGLEWKVHVKELAWHVCRYGVMLQLSTVCTLYPQSNSRKQAKEQKLSADNC